MSFPPLFTTDLDAMLAGILGSDVVFDEADAVRGILSREWRVEEDSGGMAQQIQTLVLTVRDGTLPAACREGSTLTIGGVEHVVRRRCPVDDMGAREYFVAVKS